VCIKQVAATVRQQDGGWDQAIGIVSWLLAEDLDTTRSSLSHPPFNGAAIARSVADLPPSEIVCGGRWADNRYAFAWFDLGNNIAIRFTQVTWTLANINTAAGNIAQARLWRKETAATHGSICTDHTLLRGGRRNNFWWCPPPVIALQRGEIEAIKASAKQ